MLTKSKPEDAKRFLELAQRDAGARWRMYEHLAAMHYGPNGGEAVHEK